MTKIQQFGLSHAEHLPDLRSRLWDLNCALLHLYRRIQRIKPEQQRAGDLQAMDGTSKSLSCYFLLKSLQFALIDLIQTTPVELGQQLRQFIFHPV